MGNGASVQPELFKRLKEEYEAKKIQGLSEDDLFTQMKAYYEKILSDAAVAVEAAAPAPAAPVAVDPVVEVKVDPVPVEVVALVETSAA